MIQSIFLQCLQSYRAGCQPHFKKDVAFFLRAERGIRQGRLFCSYANPRNPIHALTYILIHKYIIKFIYIYIKQKAAKNENAHKRPAKPAFAFFAKVDFYLLRTKIT